MPTTPHLFGGDWTDDKLERVRKYLVAYATIMNKQRFRFAYIDAFAGTGYRTPEKEKESPQRPILEVFDTESQEFLDGSARIALQVKPRFNKYIFIERNRVRFAELQKLKTEYPEQTADIILVKSEANAYIKELCLHRDWSKSRAVLFLDPYGMQVPWDTIEAIAKTQAIDMWLLFPLGIGVNRMMTKDGKINKAWRRKLDIMFGETGWYEEFYKAHTRGDIFGGQQTELEKVADFDSISQYFVRRLKTVFAGVAENPLHLYNSRNNPLYLLCFASGNHKGSTTAIKIAQDILRR
jgi:three-Cys-motif partner protein